MKENTSRKYWLVATVSSAVGAIASFLQIIERIQWAERPQATLVCDLNSTFSCSSVFDAWQSSVFGFSNSIMCLAFFAVILGFSLAGLYSAELRKNIRLIMHFFAVFFLAFGAWYIEQTMLAVGSLCIYCIFCYAGVIGINWAMLRLNAGDLPLSNSTKSSLMGHIKKGNDTFIWLLYTLIFVAMFAYKFWIR